MTSNVFAATLRARLTLLAVFAITLLCASPTKAGTTITQSFCPVVILQPGEYSLGTDVGPCLPGVDGIDIIASGVTLHLNGHTVTGNPDSSICDSASGISVGLPAPAPMLSQVHVLGDGTISNFSIGFSATNSAGSFVKFVTLTGCGGDYSAFLISSPGSQWKLERNVVRWQYGYGIRLEFVDDNDLVGNDVNAGIILLVSNNNIIVNNSAHDSSEGISLINANNNEIAANTTDNNAYGLFVTQGSGNNVISGNNSFNNIIYDMVDFNTSCDSNKWKGNHFNTANQSCIQ